METPVGRELPLHGGGTDLGLFQKAKALEREAKNAILTSRTWHYEHMLGHGSYGVAMLLIERDHLRSRRPRRVVLKLSLETAGGDNDLTQEAEALDLLRGHAHIVQQISYTKDVSSFQPTGGRIRRTLRRVAGAFRNPPEKLFGYLSGMSRSDAPALLLEYLENGNLIKIMEQIHDRRYQLPNRLLWGWYHCLVSACVAMTYAREGPINRPVELEVPQRDHQHLRLTHNDIAPRNVMIDELDPLVQAHRATPKLALIDFGMARQLPPGGERVAENRNLEDVNTFMLALVNPAIIINDRGFYPYGSNGLRTMAAGLFDGVRLSLLDPELRTLLAHSFRIGDDDEPFGRPSLAETFERTRRGMLKPVESYQAQVREGDDYIRWSDLDDLSYSFKPVMAPFQNLVM
ncbi:hypothetical protein F4801DRAFT_581162 [Xylaria longipes]|nr:hypothetical protein F4801DRAFT_581162 [Xylaria longipes]